MATVNPNFKTIDDVQEVASKIAFAMKHNQKIAFITLDEEHYLKMIEALYIANEICEKNDIMKFYVDLRSIEENSNPERAIWTISLENIF